MGWVVPVTDISAAKATARARAREALRDIHSIQTSDAGERAPRASTPAACAALTAVLVTRHVRTVAAYVPLPGELDVLPILASLLHHGVRVVVPRILGEDLEFADYEPTQLSAGQFGIREPAQSARTISLAQCDAILVPALACDLVGGRLGRGRGFYDRALANVPMAAWKVGCVVAANLWRAGDVPTEPHDVRMDAVATELAVINVTASP